LMMAAPASSEVSVSTHMPNRWQNPQVYAVFFHSIMQTIIIAILSFKVIIT
jgi:hypothetical protein